MELGGAVAMVLSSRVKPFPAIFPIAMKSFFHFRFFPFAFCLLLCSAGYSHLEASALVREVEFRKARLPGSGEVWMECSVEIVVRRDPQDGSRRDPRFVDNLSVEFMMGTEARSRGERVFEFYRARADLVSVEEGEVKTRFYLPPEVIDRDRLGDRPHSFFVRLLRGDQLLAEGYSESLEREGVRSSFLGRVAGESEANAGVLLPQNKTPFMSAHPDDTPSFRDIASKTAREN